MNRQEFMRQLEYLLRGIPENEKMDALAYYNNYFDEAGVENEQNVIRELGSPEHVAQTILADFRESGYGAPRDYGAPEMGTRPAAYEGGEHQQNQGAYHGGEYQKNQGTYNDGGYQQNQSTYNSGGYQQNQSTYHGGGYQQSQGQSVNVPRKKMSTSTIILIVILAVLTFPLWIGLFGGLFGGLVGLLGGLFGIVVGIAGAGIGLLVGSVVCIGGGILAVFTAPMEGFAMIGVGAILLAVSILMVLFSVLLTFQWLPVLVKAVVKWGKGLLHRQKGGDEI